MSAIKWYKRDPDAALGGMMVLTLEERGAYNTVLDLIYSHDDNLIDDDRFIAGWMRCDLRVWRRIKNRLVELGKIELSGGLVTNFRATSEVDEALGRVASVSEVNRIKGIKSGIARRKINGLTEPTVEPKMNTPTPTPTPIEEEGTNVPSSAPPPISPETLDAKTIEAIKTSWNNLASEMGLTQVQHLSEARRKKLKLRLKEIGGLEGWYVLCDKIRGSPYLTGQVKDWKCTFDWVFEPKNLTKIMEGNYDDRQHGNGKDRHDQGTNFTRAAKKVSDAIDRRIAEAEAAERGERGSN
jgi:uncharacterized protein YdaU (DUF1376 family)